MSWNYRVFKQDTPKSTQPHLYFIGECYYEDGQPSLHSDMTHNLLSGDTPDEVAESVRMVGEALRAQVIELDEEGNFKNGTN